MNLYLPVYKRIEEEVVALTNSIFFNDDQLKVFSLAIGDIIIRCSVEIEAIAKELYLRLGGNPNPVDDEGNNRDLYFDTDCMALLVDKWKINEKKIQIVHPNMYFSQTVSVLTPLHKAHKRGTSGSKWKQAYQNIKHNRSQTIKWASVENMLNAVGALYVLNLYYADESFWAETPIQGRSEFNPESQIFSPFIADATKISMKKDMGDDQNSEIQDPGLTESIYIQKVTDDSFMQIHKMICRSAIAFTRKALTEESYEELKKLPADTRAMEFDAISNQIGFCDIDTIKRELVIGGFHNAINRKEIILNHDDRIYPSLKYADYLKTDEGIKEIEK